MKAIYIEFDKYRDVKNTIQVAENTRSTCKAHQITKVPKRLLFN